MRSLEEVHEAAINETRTYDYEGLVEAFADIAVLHEKLCKSTEDSIRRIMEAGDQLHRLVPLIAHIKK